MECVTEPRFLTFLRREGFDGLQIEVIYIFSISVDEICGKKGHVLTIEM